MPGVKDMVAAAKAGIENLSPDEVAKSCQMVTCCSSTCANRPRPRAA